jgi:hypothetical protein
MTIYHREYKKTSVQGELDKFIGDLEYLKLFFFPMAPNGCQSKENWPTPQRYQLASLVSKAELSRYDICYFIICYSDADDNIFKSCILRHMSSAV